MGKSMNPKMSGFRKWAEIHEPTKVDKARTGANEGGVIAAADVHQDRKTPDAEPSLMMPGIIISLIFSEQSKLVLRATPLQV